MRAAFLIARKDLRLRIRDRSAFLWGVIGPFALAAIFSLVFNPVSEIEFEAEYAVVDQDGGPIAQAFLQQLESMEAQGIVTLTRAQSVEEARAWVETGSDAFAGEAASRADAAFVLPSGLSERVLAGEAGELTVIGARGSQLASQVAFSLASGFASELHAVNLGVQAALPPGEHVDEAAVAALAQRAAAPPPPRAPPPPAPVSLEDISAATKQLDGTTQVTAGMAVFFLFFTVQFGVSGLLEERRLGTMSRLLAAPISRRAIIAGKALTSFALGVASMTVLAVMTTLLLGADWGHPLGVGLLIVAGVFAAMGVLAVVASVARTQEQAGNFGAIISLVLGLLGGTFFPVAQVGGLLELLTMATPHHWFLRGLGDLAGGHAADVLPSVGALLLFGLVTGSVSWIFLRRAVMS